MNKKLIFRIMGAIASALIIVAVFVPFVSVTGYSSSLWETYKAIDTLYLPIMIIAFGVIGVIFFSLNVKTEFAYMSTGAIIFFMMMQTIDVIDQDTFNTLSIGYYFLGLGAILTGIMAFLCNLKPKNNEKVQSIEEPEQQITVLNQIDKLYNNEASNDVISPIQVEPAVQPIPVVPVQSVTPEIQQSKELVSEPVQTIQPGVQVEPQHIVTPVVQEPIITQTVQSSQPVNPVLQDFNINSIQNEKPAIQEPIINQPEVAVGQSSQPINPVLQEFSQSQITPMEPLIQEVNQQPVNPVLQDFNMNSTESVQPVTESVVETIPNEFSVPLASINNEVKENPVLQQFSDTSQGIIATPNLNTNSSDTDIFGQPINK